MTRGAMTMAAMNMGDKPMQRSAEPWPQAIQDDLQRNRMNGSVGTRLLSENDRVRVWEIRLAPGERIHFHRHVLDYFWTAVTAGKALSHEEDGTAVMAEYEAGETRHARYGKGEYKLHDLQNVGSTPLVFTTVEFKDSANAPLPVG